MASQSGAPLQLVTPTLPVPLPPLADRAPPDTTEQPVRKRLRSKLPKDVDLVPGPDGAIVLDVPASELVDTMPFMQLGPANPLVVEMMAADGLAALPGDARRQCMHFTQCRTHDEHMVQPEQLTREQLWNIINLCYLEGYPDARSPTQSILLFGLVVKEKHKDAPQEADCSEHHHLIAFCSQKHYWSRIRKIAAKKYKIHVNAVAHDGYSSMYRYLRCATKKKPIHELDEDPWFSPLHPKGEKLKELLEHGEKTRKARAERNKAPDEVGAPPAVDVRSVFGFAFNWVIDKQLRGSVGALQLQGDAASEVQAGRPRLMEFVRKHRNDLADQIAFMWELVEAPKRMARMKTPRQELLLQAATMTMDPQLFAKTCANGDCKCADLYEKILDYQGVSSCEFRHLLFETLTAGREKGNATMIVGGKDSGKTTITQPAAQIFNAMPTPQSDSFCPLQNCRGYEVFLWQDLRYSPGHPVKDQQGMRIDEGTWNRLLEGLPTLIGVAKTDGGRSDFVFDEDVAFLFTGPFQLVAWRNGRQDDHETEQLATRMKYVNFSRPAPPRQGKGKKPCPFCWSRWLLLGEAMWRRATSRAFDEFMTRVEQALVSVQPPRPPATPQSAASLELPLVDAGDVRPPSGPPAFFSQLTSLIEWRSQGHLSEAEFIAAKRALGLN